MKNKTKVFISLSLVILFVLLTILTIVSIFASSKQNFKSNVNINYTVPSYVDINVEYQDDFGEYMEPFDIKGLSVRWSFNRMYDGFSWSNITDGSAHVDMNGKDEWGRPKNQFYLDFSFETDGNNFPLELSITYQDEGLPDSNCEIFAAPIAYDLPDYYFTTISDPFINNKLVNNMYANKMKIYFQIEKKDPDLPIIFSGKFNVNVSDLENASDDESAEKYQIMQDFGVSFCYNDEFAIVSDLAIPMGYVYIPETYLDLPIKKIAYGIFYFNEQSDISTMILANADVYNTFYDYRFLECGGIFAQTDLTTIFVEQSIVDENGTPQILLENFDMSGPDEGVAINPNDPEVIASFYTFTRK